MVKRMGGNRPDWDYSVLVSEHGTAILDTDKAEILAQNFVMVHSSGNLSEDALRRKAQTRAQYPDDLVWKMSLNHHLNSPITMDEVNRALRKANPTSPGKDQVCYAMLNNLGSEGRKKLLLLYNKVWIEGKLPSSWKEAVIIVPIKKPGKDPSKPGS
ncbi:unnamed protein product [Knipowitschia caucasica]